MPAKYILSKYSYTLDLLLITLTNNPSNFHISHNYILPHSLRFIAKFQYLIPTKRKENKAYGCRYRGGGGGGGGGMKFGKRLKQQVEETLPEWRDKFLSYKDLKKVVKLVSCVSPSMLMGGSLDLQQQGSKGEAEFVYLLNDEIEKFNAFFMEQEEDFIIRHKELQQRIQKAVVKWGPWGSQLSDTAYLQEIRNIRKDIVDFHGEMVLLINYSNINYTGLAKILKKYDKRTGGLLRLAFIQKVSQQPFFTTELISKLIKECESTIDTLFPVSQQSIKQGENAAAITVVGEGIFRNTVAALLTMKEIRRSSSTYGHHSLPPLNLPDSDIIHSLHAKPPIPIP